MSGSDVQGACVNQANIASNLREKILVIRSQKGMAMMKY